MNVIEIKNLKKYFGQVKAVDDISFNVDKGEVFGFLGPNGAGKTTTIRCLMDFIRPTSGTITILGKDAQKNSVDLKGKIGYLSGSVRLYEKWTGQEHIDFISSLNGGQDIARELVERLGFNPALRVKQLSSGNLQKLGIILAFVCQPKLLILDEPTNTLDPILQIEVYKLLKEAVQNGATVFMSSHNLAEVEKVCHKVGIIRQGRMAAIESIRTLNEKHLYTAHVYFAGGFNKNDFNLDGLAVIKEFPDGLDLTIKGNIDPLLKKLNNYKVKDLEIHHATLEDIFMEFYEQPSSKRKI